MSLISYFWVKIPIVPCFHTCIKKGKKLHLILCLKCNCLQNALQKSPNFNKNALRVFITLRCVSPMAPTDSETFLYHSQREKLKHN